MEYTYDELGRPLSIRFKGETFWYVYNGHGDVVAFTDQNGEIAARYEYDEWGLVTRMYNRYGERVREGIGWIGDLNIGNGGPRSPYGPADDNEDYDDHPGDGRGNANGWEKNNKEESEIELLSTEEVSLITELFDASLLYAEEDEVEPTADITTDLVKENPFRYAGYYWDRKTQFYYLQARYYEPRDGRFISMDVWRGDVTNPLSLNRYVYGLNNPINFVDPSGLEPVMIGHVYVIRGIHNGDNVAYVGSTAQELKKRLGNHQWNLLLKDKNTTVDVYDVNAELDVGKSGRRTLRSALNEALRAAEQLVIDKVKGNSEKTVNKRNAATDVNQKKWADTHNLDIDLNSPKGTLKGGVKLGAFGGFALLDTFLTYRSMITSKYQFAPYLLEDDGGVFTIGYGSDGWLSKTKYWKTYESGPKSSQKEYLSKDDFNYWKEEAKALWGYLDFWGNFAPGLLNPVLPEVYINDDMT